jgi:hypothetical protein
MVGHKVLWTAALCSWIIPLSCALLDNGAVPPVTPVDAWKQVNWTCGEILNNVRPNAPNATIREIYNACEKFQIDEYRKAIAKE